MQTRKLGNSNLEVSALGLVDCGLNIVGLSHTVNLVLKSCRA